MNNPGIYTNIPSDDYHADPCPVPSLSRSVALALVRQSPMHARALHPRLSPGPGREDVTQGMDEGSALHALMLGEDHKVRVMRSVYGAKHERAGEPVTDFRTKDAAEERDNLRSRGSIPVLRHRHDSLCAARDAALAVLRTHEIHPAWEAAGDSEAVVLAQHGPVWLRAMVDRLPTDPMHPPLDLKLTGMSAAPEAWERRLITEYAFQCAFYRRVLAEVEGRLRPPMRFIVIETNPPHGVSVMAAGPSLEELATAEVNRAVALWASCMETGNWPGYPPLVAHVHAPTWMIQRAAERDARDEVMERIEG